MTALLARGRKKCRKSVSIYQVDMQKVRRSGTANVNECSVSLRRPNTKRQSVLVGVSSELVDERHDNSPEFAASAIARVTELVRDAIWWVSPRTNIQRKYFV